LTKFRIPRFTAKPERKDDPRLKAFIEVFKSP
jgi:hypothetical protein